MHILRCDASMNFKNHVFSKASSSSVSRILVPIDGSDSSMKALELAIDLATKYKSKLCIVNVIPTYQLYCWLMAPGGAFCHESLFIPTGVLKEMEEEGKNLLVSALSFVQGIGVESYAIMRKGHPASEIIRVAEEENIDLIVIGNEKRGIFARLLFGNVSQSVANKAPCPVLIVKRDETHGDDK